MDVRQHHRLMPRLKGGGIIDNIAESGGGARVPVPRGWRRH